MQRRKQEKARDWVFVIFEQMGVEENIVEDSLNVEIISNGKGDRGKEEA